MCALPEVCARVRGGRGVVGHLQTLEHLDVKLARPPAGGSIYICLASDGGCPGGTAVLLFRFLGCSVLGSLLPRAYFCVVFPWASRIRRGLCKPPAFQGSCGGLSGSPACSALQQPV